MKFWDSSALIPLVSDEPRSADMKRLFESDTGQMVWWGSVVECESALSRRAREPGASADAAEEARRRLDAFAHAWLEVGPSESLRDSARRLLRVHPLRTADAVQLAAALVASEQHPETLELVCLDERLSAAAKKEGFRVLEGKATRREEE